MATAHDVAAALITQQNAAGRTIDKMQLEKLLFVVQGAHCEMWGEPAFTGEFRAFKRGPVIEGVEASYRSAVEGKNPITEPLGGHPDRLPESVRETIDLVLDMYGTWTGPNLEKQVKKPGSPWTVARGDLPPDANSNIPIPNADIQAWYRRYGVQPVSNTRHGTRDLDLLRRAAAGEPEALSALTQ